MWFHFQVRFFGMKLMSTLTQQFQTEFQFHNNFIHLNYLMLLKSIQQHIHVVNKPKKFSLLDIFLILMILKSHISQREKDNQWRSMIEKFLLWLRNKVKFMGLEDTSQLNYIKRLYIVQIHRLIHLKCTLGSQCTSQLIRHLLHSRGSK